MKYSIKVNEVRAKEGSNINESRVDRESVLGKGSGYRTHEDAGDRRK